MLEPSCNLLGCPLALELTCHDVGQLSLLHQFARLGSTRPIPSRLIGLGCTVAALATVALDLAANGGWSTSKQATN